MLIVKKFGGSSVANKERIFRVAERCIEEYKKGNDVVVVLSAMGDTTDELLAKAADINPNAPKRELDMLLTTGEQVSVSLMAMAMHALGVPAVSLNAYQVMMHSTSRYGNARFKRIDSERIRHELDSRKIVIVTGFQGINRNQDITTLGKGDLPICVAKTQYSLSDNQKLLGRPEGFTIHVGEVRLSAGAGFIVVQTGDIMTMPGLPKVPAANQIDVDEDGQILGLF